MWLLLVELAQLNWGGGSLNCANNDFYAILKQISFLAQLSCTPIHSWVGPTQPNLQIFLKCPKNYFGEVLQWLSYPPGGNSTAIALWPCKKLTGPKQTARFLGGSLLVVYLEVLCLGPLSRPEWAPRSNNPTNWRNSFAEQRLDFILNKTCHLFLYFYVPRIRCVSWRQLLRCLCRLIKAKGNTSYFRKHSKSFGFHLSH